jgi:hypothetical protein
VKETSLVSFCLAELTRSNVLLITIFIFIFIFKCFGEEESDAVGKNMVKDFYSVFPLEGKNCLAR